MSLPLDLILFSLGESLLVSPLPLRWRVVKAFFDLSEAASRAG
jgi:hypothetical protein